MLLRDEYERQSAELYHTRRGQDRSDNVGIADINIYNFLVTRSPISDEKLTEDRLRSCQESSSQPTRPALQRGSVST